MSRTVDLHGLFVQDASILIVSNLNDLTKNRISSILFITGKGTGALKSELEHILSTYDVEYEILNKQGAYLVKNKIQYYIYEEDEIASQKDIDKLYDEEISRKKW
ncbi:Smr/MutS family protein [Mycoplasmopsis alligatoris]|uniref:Smr domain protein n=1 Tax=Mycoplasmopsis alligatoris A21JP2 TaxID=747682 RepID=D4XX10_9BACT|nr:Smr/MutS family protein [Mycoplasmopsis alligatoris]EFF41336.1 Smr domain protein [Mycoplasmopsis alligatoris A21JP2]